MAEEAADDIPAVTFIDGRIPVQEIFQTRFCFVGRNNFNLFRYGNLRIGNHERRKKRMGMVTAGTDNPADTERELSSRHFQGTGIIAMNRKAAGMTTGAGKSVKLQSCNKIIIKSLSNGIEIFDKYGYHSLAVHRRTYGVWMRQETKLWLERFLLLLLIVTLI